MGDRLVFLLSIFHLEVLNVLETQINSIFINNYGCNGKKRMVAGGAE